MTPLVATLIDAWTDLEQVTASLSDADAERRLGNASPIAWTVAHLLEHLDRVINVERRSQPPHPVVGSDRFRFGAGGEPAPWRQVQEALRQVQASCRDYLARLTEADLSASQEYVGRWAPLQGRQVSLRYSLTRAVLHHYYHIGEMATARKALGHDVGDYPGLLEHSLA